MPFYLAILARVWRNSGACRASISGREKKKMEKKHLTGVSPAMSAIPAVLETQKAAHGHLAAVYDKIQSAASRCNILARAKVHSPAAFLSLAHLLFVVVVMLHAMTTTRFRLSVACLLFLLWAKVLSLSDGLL
jgi:hypothetical protein